MQPSLFESKDYGVFTFVSTYHALKAEKILKASDMGFLMMPTPREISTSCGLAVKVAPGDLSVCLEILKKNQVQVDGAFQISLVKGKTSIARITDG